MTEKTPIPELPKDVKELEKLLAKEFRVVWEGEPASIYGGEYKPGGIAVSSVSLKCPFCETGFIATRKSGCIGETIYPDVCPNCGFPEKVTNALIALSTKRKGEQGGSK